MLISQAFSCLGIPISKDVRAIKQAYRKQLSLYHPEENPEGFALLHEAYKTALNFAQDKFCPPASGQSFTWRPDTSCSDREITGYDSLFASLDEKNAVDMTQLKKDFSRKLRWLTLHWLPIPLNRWVNFFNSKAYLFCRTEPDDTKKLFDLILGKIHSYAVLRFLISQLWELHIWQKSEGLQDLALKTENCITELREQYRHYLKLNSASRVASLIRPVLWYYQALPFYFKLIVATFLIPPLSFGSGMAMLYMLGTFYVLEFFIFFLKICRKLGIFHPTARIKKGILTVKSRGDSGILIIITIYAILGHLCGCIYFFELFTGLL